MRDLPKRELARIEWSFIEKTLREARDRLEANGTRHSWMDPAVNIASERARKKENR
jgi:hypothetical protein